MCTGTLVMAALLLALTTGLTIARCFHSTSPNAKYLCAAINTLITDEKKPERSTILQSASLTGNTRQIANRKKPRKNILSGLSSVLSANKSP